MAMDPRLRACAGMTNRLRGNDESAMQCMITRASSYLTGRKLIQTRTSVTPTDV